LGVEVGYQYQSGALISDGTPPKVVDDPETDYVPTTRPGARLPHVWLDAGRARISTLDLLDSRHFTLIVGGEASAWYAAAEEARRDCGVNVQVAQVGGAFGILDPLGHWAARREVADDGAVLVRPDGHVAWRARDRSGAEHFAQALRTIVGRAETAPGRLTAARQAGTSSRSLVDTSPQ
jgi:2,4-dichlorophenol 6-monooxygenase